MQTKLLVLGLLTLSFYKPNAESNKFVVSNDSTVTLKPRYKEQVRQTIFWFTKSNNSLYQKKYA